MSEQLYFFFSGSCQCCVLLRWLIWPILVDRMAANDLIIVHLLLSLQLRWLTKLSLGGIYLSKCYDPKFVSFESKIIFLVIIVLVRYACIELQMFVFLLFLLIFPPMVGCFLSGDNVMLVLVSLSFSGLFCHLVQQVSIILCVLC